MRKCLQQAGGGGGVGTGLAVRKLERPRRESVCVCGTLEVI